MAAATLDDIDAALYEQLGTLLDTADPAGAFVQLLRFSGESSTTPSRDARVPLAPQGKVPAVMLAFERETYRVAESTAQLRVTSTIGRSTWRVFVVASELRGDAAAVKGSSTTGVFALVSAVTGALAGLAIDGTYQGHRVELLDVVPAVVRRGEYVSLVRLAVERAIPSVAIADDSDDLAGIDGGVNLVVDGALDDSPDGTTVPFDTFEADTTDDS